jgi:UDP-N-acetylmuramoyl-L-alanyl-D-glutamate--2,6-diaminopimelate ligase
MKLLKDLIYGIRLKEVIGNTHIAIEQVTSDSRAVRKNSLFVAIRGTQRPQIHPTTHRTRRCCHRL